VKTDRQDTRLMAAFWGDPG